MSEIKAPPIATVMLIDDEEVDQMLYRRIVERSAHAETLISFVDAGKALQYLIERREPRPDLILLDINMPVMDGFGFLDLAAKELGRDQTPVIFMLTTSFDPQDRARAEANDLVQGYVEKPLTEQKLEDFRLILADLAPGVA